jgi:N-acetylneuraminate synthase/N,N'-diacetyllegionaminate synthase
MHEISEIKKTLRAFGNSIHWFYCVSHYPTLPEEINWDLLQMFDGFSDHTIGVNCAKKAVDFETKYIEKHFTLSRNLPGTDQQLSIEPHELLLLSEYIKNKEKEKMYKKRWSNECISSNL